MPTIDDFFEAITAGNAQRVRRMLAAQPSLLTAVNDTGDTPIFWALYHQHPHLVTLLLELGALLDIHEAAALGRTARIQELLAQDPGLVNAYSQDGWTPLHLAALYSHTEAAKLLLDCGADVHALTEGIRFVSAGTPLHAAVAAGHADLATLLLDAGADPNTPDGDGYAPLHLAAATGNADAVRLLLQEGANPNAAVEGKTPLALARERGNVEVVETLQRVGL